MNNQCTKSAKSALDEWLTSQKPLLRSDFAEQIGITNVTLSRLMSGDRRPSFDLMSRIHDATDGAVTYEMWRHD